MEKYISLAGFCISLIGTLVGLWCWYRKKLSSISFFRRYIKYRFFYPDSLVKEILSNNINKNLPDSEFIDYSLAIRNNYYEKDVMTLSINREGEIQQVQLPYKEIINYIQAGATPQIEVVTKDLEQFQLSQKLVEATEGVLADFISTKKNPYDSPTLRIKSLVKQEKGFKCELQKASYYDQVRTNLTLDVPIVAEGSEDSMRVRDLSHNQCLKPFEESIMANTIGVSGIWYTQRSSIGRHDRIHFFLKPRKKGVGVFSSMLGTTSGVVVPPSKPIASLEEYLIQEMRREFYEETGFKRYMADHNISEEEVQIIPLAFTRELLRGGKPQFFFIIKTPPISNRKWHKYFSKSFNGKEEFYDTPLSNTPIYKLSPETQTNLLYAYAYLQRNHGLGYIDLND
ncbi:MAG: hypothetical protein IKK64_05830 [Bacteroidales bacterium]|nr:hypothetical protein [Bacteroidales bacterium]